jgi:acetyl-CoA C-acetyltransferase
MEEVFVLAAVRTPIGKFMGGLSSLAAPQLGAIAIHEALRRAHLPPDRVQEVLMGNVLQAGVGQAPARQAMIYAGLPPQVPAVTINKVCGSGLKAAMIGSSAIRAGEAEVVVAGGMESMSNAPYLIPSARRGSRLGHAELVDHLVADGLWDPYGNMHMGETAELVAEKYGISRVEMDEFAVESHRKAVAAARSGAFHDEIVPVEIKGKKGDTTVVDRDEGPREDATPEALARLKPAFRAQGGTVTPGNASTINDGAAAVVLMSGGQVRTAGARPLARVLGYSSGGVEPRWVMMAPLEAVRNLESRCGLKAVEMDLIEINEAFAVQSCALIREMKLDPSRVNVHGGAVALGHPIGCSGARVLVTLIHALRRRGLKRGLATLCLGGGNAVAMAVEAA